MVDIYLLIYLHLLLSSFVNSQSSDKLWKDSTSSIFGFFSGRPINIQILLHFWESYDIET